MVLKTIDTLVEDINEVLCNGSERLTDELLDKYATSFKEMLRTRLAAPREPRGGSLRMSNIGKPCDRQLYYEVNHTQEAEELRPEVYMKFLFGDVVELLLTFLVEASGHTLEGMQDEQEIEGVKGHRDAVIDGTLVDVKSASSYSFKKFQNGNLEDNDSFGYIDQIQSYLYCAQNDDKVTDKDRAAFLVVDKTLGHICLDIHKFKNIPYEKIFAFKKKMVASPEPPPRGFEPVPEGKSGNMALGVNCGYCLFKKKCYPELRTFLYSNGPKYLVHVEKTPNVPEVF